MLYPRRLFSASISIYCLAILTGCGSKGPTLSGTVVLPANLKLVQNDVATISFVPDGAPEGESSQSFGAAINPSDLTFVAKGPAGKGIAPGKYKIGFNYQPYKPMDGKQKKNLTNFIKQYEPSNSRMTYEVTAEPQQQSIAVDLGKGTVTKQ